MAEAGHRRGIALAAVVLGLAVAGAYAGALGAGFVFDDHTSIVRNAKIDTGEAALSGLRRFTNLTFMIDARVSVWLTGAARDPRVFHFTNLLVHALAVVALLLLLRELGRLAGRGPRAALLVAFAPALVWAVHPLNTEAVTYVVHRSEALAALGWLGCVFAAVRGMRRAEAAGGGAAGWWIGSLLFWGVGLASKPTAVTAPLAVWLIDAALVSRGLWRPWRRRWGYYGGVGLALGVPFVLAVVWQVAGGRSVGFELEGIPWYAYLWSQPAVIGWYGWLALWPANLSVDYAMPPYRWPADAGPILAGLTALAGVGGALAWGAVRGRVAAVLGVLALLYFAPSSSFIPLGDLVAERRAYLPLGLLLGALAWALDGWARRRSGGGGASGGGGGRGGGASIWAMPMAALVVAVPLASRTIDRNRDYRGPTALWRATIRTHPENARAHTNLGAAWLARDRVDEAIASYRRAVALRPRYLPARHGLAVALLHGEAFEAAAGVLEETLALEPEDREGTERRLVAALLGAGRSGEAVRRLQSHLERHPACGWAHRGLGEARERQGELGKALAAYRAWVRARPEDPEARRALGMAMLRAGSVAGAVRELARAVEAAPERADTRYAYAQALMRAEARGEAIRELGRLVARHPSHARALNDLAVVSAASGEARDAERWWRRATEAEPDFLPPWVNLVTLLARNGREAAARQVIARARRHHPEAAALDRLASELGE